MKLKQFASPVFLPLFVVGLLILLLTAAPASAGLFSDEAADPPRTDSTVSTEATSESTEAPAPYPAPTLVSDQSDYPPGAKVILTGENWQGDTSVHVAVNDTLGRTWFYETDAAVEEDGTITVELWIAYYFISDYDVVATGNQTGRVATTTFTDDKKISGILFRDLNGNGVQDVGESLISGAGTWTVKAYKAGVGTLISSVTTTSGSYDNLSVGNNDSVIVVVSSMAGWTLVSTAGPSGGGGTEVDTSGIAGVFPKGRSFAMGNAHKSGVDFGFLADAAIPITVTADAKTKVYGDVDPALTYQITSGSLLPGDSASGSLTRVTGESVGTYEIQRGTLAFPAYYAVTYVPANLVITPQPITGTFTAANKVYDGTTAATVTGRSLVGALTGDDVELSGGTATFADKNVGTGKTVTLSGATLSGADAGNYSLTSVAPTTADITPASLTISFTADDKVYDGTTDAVISNPQIVVGHVAGDDVHVSLVAGAKGTFEDAMPGANKKVSADSSDFELNGSDAGNYRIGTVNDARADILYALSPGNFFLPPINTPGHGIPVSVFKAGSTIPVKFQLFDAFGNPVGFAQAHIIFWRYSTTVPGGEEELTVASQASTGTLFRYDPVSQQYIFNLSTKGFPKGQYFIRVNLGTGQYPQVEIGLK